MCSVLTIASCIGVFSCLFSPSFLFQTEKCCGQVRPSSLPGGELALSQFSSQFDLVSSFSNFLLMAIKDKKDHLVPPE